MNRLSLSRGSNVPTTTASTTMNNHEQRGWDVRVSQAHYTDAGSALLKKKTTNKTKGSVLAAH